MVLGLIVSLIGTLGVVMASEATAAPKEASPFVGEWETIDVFDGSYMRMKITGHHQPQHVKLVDDWASLCPEGGPATMIGKVVYSDPVRLEADGRVRCHVGNDKLPGGVVGFWYIGPDMLADSWGNLWFRIS
jgi:hypothetical protein